MVVVGFVIQKSRSLYLLRSICMAMMVLSSNTTQSIFLVQEYSI